MKRRNIAFFLAISLSFLSACSSDQEPQGLGDPYVVDLTTLPTVGEGMLTLKADSGSRELSGFFQVGPYSIDIRVDREIASKAGVNINKPFEDNAKVVILGHDEASSGFHQIYQISAIEIL